MRRDNYKVRKTVIKTLIGLISFSLLGLLAVQIHWINGAIDLKQEEFDQKVNTSLLNVASRLEKKESLERVKQFQAANTKKELSALNTKKGLVKKEEIKIHVKGEKNARIELDSSSHSKYLKQTGYVDHIIKELYDPKYRKPIEERIDHFLLDSILKAELFHLGIRTKYRHAIINENGYSLMDVAKLNKIVSSPYRTRLYPNDILGEPYYLAIHFPYRKGYLLKSMWVILATLILFLILITVSFGYTINTILKQKKLSDVKNDFISNMTHELKTPISTIALASEALSDSSVTDESRRKVYLSMISKENKRLAMLVENVLESAVWDSETFNLKPEIF